MIAQDALGDAVVSWLGGLGALSAWLHLGRGEIASLQQRRARLLLGALAALLLVRGFFWILPSARLFQLTFVPATLVPLGMALFVEGLLRRHLPLGLKLLAAGGSAFFFALNLAGVMRRGSPWVLALAGFEVVLLAALGWVVLRRDRAGLSPAENRFIEGIWLALLLAIPLVLTDFRGALGWPPARLGALGALIFAHALLRQAGRRSLLREIAGLAGRALVLAVALGAVLGAGDDRVWHLAAASCGFVLLAALWQRLADVRAEVRQGSFLAWWAGADMGSLGRFLEALGECPVAGSHLLVSGEALAGYDERALADRLRESPVASLPALQAALRTAPGAETGERRAAEEQLLDLLVERGMEHACLVRARPLAILLLGHAPLGGSPATDLEIALLQKGAALLAEREAAHA
ncbi:MAG: hypothetical protein ACLGI9_11110 [Thermoanaerobaculia bacterium]